MKYLASFGCASIAFTWFACVSGSAYAQQPSTPESPPAPAAVAPPAEAAAPAQAAPRSEAAQAAPQSEASAPAQAASQSEAAPPAQAAPQSEAAPEPVEPTAVEPASGAESKAPDAPKPASPHGAAQTSVAPVAAPQDSEVPESFSGQLGSHQDHWLVWLGVRNDYVRDATYDLFSGNDALTAFSVGAGRTVWSSGDLSLAALGLWEIGSRSEEVRGNETSLRVQRLQLAPEVRYHLHYRAYGFGRLGLGAEHAHATLEDELFDGELVSNSWAFAGDLAGGAAVQLFGSPSGEQRKPRLWLVAEGGYSLVTNSQLSFSAESGAPERAEDEDLGELDLSAPFFRVAALVSY